MVLITPPPSSEILLALLKNLTELEEQLPKLSVETTPDESSIDQIRQAVFSQLTSSFQNLGSAVPLFLEETRTCCVPSNFADSSLRARIKLLQTKSLIENVTSQIRDMINASFAQDKNEAIQRIDTLFGEARDLFQNDAETTSKLLKDQENLFVRCERLKLEEVELQNFVDRCEELRQGFNSVGERIQRADEDFSHMSLHMDENKDSINTQSETVKRLIRELSGQMERVRSLETELQVDENEENLHANAVAETSAAVSLLNGEMDKYVRRVSMVRRDVLRLHTSLEEMHRAITAASTSNQPTPLQPRNGREVIADPAASLVGIDRSSLAVRSFVWMFKALYRIKEACDHTSDMLSKILNRVSTRLQPKLAYCLGEKKATIITHPQIWMTSLFFILLWKGHLRKGMALYVVVSVIFHFTVTRILDKNNNFRYS